MKMIVMIAFYLKDLKVKNKPFILGIVFFWFTYAVWSQTVIAGILKDEQGQVLASLNVVLKNESTNSIVAYGFSDVNGFYSIKTNKTGKFILNISGLAYEPLAIEIEITADIKTVNKNFTLKYKPFELEEVALKIEKPIVIKKDTIVFNAKSFLKGNEVVVEDLLKNIPGVDVTSQGTVKVNGREVEKIMIEGDDLFEKGYTILTKNMSVYAIDKVQLLQNYSSNKHLKNIEHSDNVALNLTINENMKSQWFGDVSLGYGIVSENRHALRGNLIRVNKKSKFYLMGNADNVGESNLENVNQIIRPNNNNTTQSPGNNENALSFISINQVLPNLANQRININNAELLSLNGIIALTSKTKLKTLFLLNSDENTFFQSDFLFFNDGQTIFQNQENKETKKTTQTGFTKFDITYDVLPTKTIEFSSAWLLSSENYKTDLIFNQVNTNEILKNKIETIDQKITFSQKIGNKKALIITARYLNEMKPQSYLLNNFTYENLFVSQANKLLQNSKDRMQFFGLESHLYSKYQNNSLLDWKLGYQMRGDKLVSDLQLFENDILAATPSDFRNELIYTNHDFYANGKYTYLWRNFKLIPQLGLHQYSIISKESVYKQKQNPFVVNPRMGIEWEINQKNKINFAYSFNSSKPTLSDVYTNYIYTNFGLFSKGNKHWETLDTSNLMLEYELGNWGEKFFANTMIMYSKDYNFITTNAVINPNYTLSEKIYSNDKDFLYYTSQLNRYIKPLATNLKITIDGSYITFKNIVNHSNLREVLNNSFNYGIEFRSGFSGIFNYNFGTKWNRNTVISDVTSTSNDNISFLDLLFMSKKRFKVNIMSERYFFGNLEKENSTYYFLDATAKYTLSENKIAFTFVANNILNTTIFRNYIVNDVFISKHEFRLMPSYFMLKFDYRF